MCDTLVLRDPGGAWLAKNSDREPGEVQRVEFHPAVSGDSTSRLACTHVEIDQVPDRHGVLLCRPDWMWGAEMGVNDAGVAIGNEAVFSKRVLRRGAALLGMDLVRLALERAASAEAATATITGLLETHGQGGPAGHRNKSFRYDNSYLVADADSAFVLETCGRDWLVRSVRDSAALSNTYTLDGPVDMASEGAPEAGFAHLETRLHPWIGAARHRLAWSRAGLAALQREGADFASIAELLRMHARGDGFVGGSNRDLCLHAGRRGLARRLRPSHTTNTLIVRLERGQAPRIAVTGTPTPCVSLLRPVDLSPGWSVMREDLWSEGAARDRVLANNPLTRFDLRNKIDAAEAHILPLIAAGRPEEAEALVAAWDDQEFDSASTLMAAPYG
ncbi:C69 family dipeptidase [Maricaulis sp. CAU 1757]